VSIPEKCSRRLLKELKAAALANRNPDYRHQSNPTQKEKEKMSIEEDIPVKRIPSSHRALKQLRKAFAEINRAESQVIADSEVSAITRSAMFSVLYAIECLAKREAMKAAWLGAIKVREPQLKEVPSER